MPSGGGSPTHITRIFEKLQINAVESEHRRVHAVLTFLRES